MQTSMKFNIQKNRSISAKLNKQSIPDAAMYSIHRNHRDARASVRSAHPPICRCPPSRLPAVLIVVLPRCCWSPSPPSEQSSSPTVLLAAHLRTVLLLVALLLTVLRTALLPTVLLAALLRTVLLMTALLAASRKVLLAAVRWLLPQGVLLGAQTLPPHLSHVALCSDITQFLMSLDESGAPNTVSSGAVASVRRHRNEFALMVQSG